MKTAALLIVGSLAGVYAFATGDFVTPWFVCCAVIAADYAWTKKTTD